MKNFCVEEYKREVRHFFQRKISQRKIIVASLMFVIIKNILSHTTIKIMFLNKVTRFALQGKHAR